ncbi:putative iron-regulated membrane protein [Mycobacterium sp. URHB0021]
MGATRTALRARGRPYWRVLWFILGLAPLMLLVTGLSTWLYRRLVGRRRRGAQSDDGAANSIRTESQTASNPMR